MAPEEVAYILFSCFAMRSVLIFMRKDGERPYYVQVDGIDPDRVLAATYKNALKYGLKVMVPA